MSSTVALQPATTTCNNRRERRTRLNARMGVFEENIQKNQASGASSVPGGLYHDGAKEGQRAFRVKGMSATTTPPHRKKSSKVIRNLSHQLQDAISELHHTEMKHRQLSQDLLLQDLPNINVELHEGNISITIAKQIQKAAIPLQAVVRGYLVRQRTPPPPHIATSTSSSSLLSTPAPDEETGTRCPRRSRSSNSRTMTSSSAVRFASKIEEFGSAADEMRLTLAAMKRQLEAIPGHIQSDLAHMRASFESQQRALHRRFEEATRGQQEKQQQQQVAKIETGTSSEYQKLVHTKEVIAYLRASNAELRTTHQRLETGIAKLQQEQIWLERENKRIAAAFKVSTIKTIKVRTENDHLVETLHTCKQFHRPMWRNTIAESKVFGESEARQTNLYRSTIAKIEGLFVALPNTSTGGGGGEDHGADETELIAWVATTIEDNAFLLSEYTTHKRRQRCQRRQRRQRRRQSTKKDADDCTSSTDCDDSSDDDSSDDSDEDDSDTESDGSNTESDDSETESGDSDDVEGDDVIYRW